MTSKHHLRPNDQERPATPVGSRLASVRPLLVAGGALAAAAAALMAGLHVAATHSSSAAPVPRFLTPALGSPQMTARLVRKPARDLRVAIRPDGYAVARSHGLVSLSSQETG